VRCAVDIAFTKRKFAVFIDGCFWHSCPDHASRAPRIGTGHAGWWIAKLRRNVERDRRVDEALSQAGWTVVRFWEHEASDYIVEQLQLLLGNRMSEHRLTVAPTEHITAMPGDVRRFDVF
jgi:DNA mismatch endonuclease (patch repair protein)